MIGKPSQAVAQLQAELNLLKVEKLDECTRQIQSYIMSKVFITV